MNIPRQALKEFASAYPTQGAAAKALRMSQTHLCELLKGRRTFSDALLKRLGLERVVIRKSA